MDNQLLINILSLAGGLGSVGFLIIKTIINSSTATTKFDRSQIGILIKRVKDLEDKIDNQEKRYDERLAIKDALIAKKDSENEELSLTISNLKEEVRDLRHRLANIEQTAGVKQELKDNENKL